MILAPHQAEKSIYRTVQICEARSTPSSSAGVLISNLHGGPISYLRCRLRYPAPPFSSSAMARSSWPDGKTVLGTQASSWNSET